MLVFLFPNLHAKKFNHSFGSVSDTFKKKSIKKNENYTSQMLHFPLAATARAPCDQSSVAPAKRKSALMMMLGAMTTNEDFHSHSLLYVIELVWNLTYNNVVAAVVDLVVFFSGFDCCQCH